jgi:hypothetical protein
MRITKGHFKGTSLDGLCFAATVDFPGALHEGNGKMQPIIDERATPKQRQAMFDIFSGRHSAEGTLFHILSLIVATIHDPVFAPFEFSSTRTDASPSSSSRVCWKQTSNRSRTL